MHDVGHSFAMFHLHLVQRRQFVNGRVDLGDHSRDRVLDSVDSTGHAGMGGETLGWGMKH